MFDALQLGRSEVFFDNGYKRVILDRLLHAFTRGNFQLYYMRKIRSTIPRCRNRKIPLYDPRCLFQHVSFRLHLVGFLGGLPQACQLMALADAINSGTLSHIFLVQAMSNSAVAKHDRLLAFVNLLAANGLKALDASLIAITAVGALIECGMECGDIWLVAVTSSSIWTARNHPCRNAPHAVIPNHLNTSWRYHEYRSPPRRRSNVQRTRIPMRSKDPSREIDVAAQRLSALLNNPDHARAERSPVP